MTFDPNGLKALVQAAKDRNVPLIDAKALVRAYLVSASPSPPALDGAGREGWQPIETAPKDGTRVLLAAPGHLTMIGSFEAWKTIHAAGPWWWSNGSMITPDPTHWQPLPAPPKETR